MAVKGVASTHIDDQKALKILFDAFLPELGKTMGDFEVQVNEQMIEIMSSDLMLLLAIHQTLSTPDVARRSLKYVINEIVEFSSPKPIVGINPKIDFSRMTGLDILNRIFSDDLFRVLSKTGLTQEELSSHDNKCTKVIRIPIDDGSGFETIAKGQLEILTAAMVGGGIHGMKKAFLEGPKLGLNKAHQSSLKLEPEFEDIFKIEANPKIGQHEIVIRYGALIDLIFPPVPELRMEELPQEKQLSKKWKMSFDRRTLLSYLIDIFEEGFILQIKNNRATPICLPKDSLVKPNNLLSLILDRSTSMEEDFPELIERVKAFLQEYISSCSKGDILRVVDFGSKSQVKEFLLTDNAQEDLDNIFTHLKTLQVGGCTRLYETVRTELHELTSDQYQGYTESVIVFTDGFNDENLFDRYADLERAQKEDEAFLQEYKENMQKLHSEGANKVPSVFSMGFGTYNRTMLEQWAVQSGVHHTHLEKIEDFDDVKAHLEKLRRPRILAKFIQKEVQRLFSVYEGTLAIPDEFTLEADVPFTFNGRTFQFATTSLQPVVESTSEILDKSKTYLPALGAVGQKGSEPNQADRMSVLFEKFRNSLVI
ncbi:VWA domain-containing protein [Candidatus Berkiella aquae]|uniref:VWA domain-containing protein n=1 Tax=Candidatus Berkiella aquae TaxID=295108 RepID=A0A0Q9YH45_9GAMM|nr:vWA domain-containing protein [Candidatus Berkiella aquae]MCS5711645.1 VWA domain-containing protein [Candidatus Berkiella aquae]